MKSLIDFVSSCVPRLKISDNPDLTFVHHQQCRYVEGPKIVIERADSSTLGFSRPLLKDKDVLGIFKHTLLEPKLQNLPFCFRRYHITVLDDVYDMGFDRESLEYVSEEDLKKVHCKVPIFMRWNSFNFKEFKKTQDIICRSSLQKIPHIVKHRQDSLIVGGQEKLLPKSEWLKELGKTKICVCPWGFGEMCYRDYEAMLSGCIVVKPNTDFVETWPNIYKAHKTYIPCREDFEDLQDICADVLRKYDQYAGMIEENKKLLNVNFEQMESEFITSMRSLNALNDECKIFV